MALRELQRLQGIHRFLNLEIKKDVELQEIVELTTELLSCPVALITLMEGDTQHFLYKVGTDKESNDIKDTFCQYLKENDLLVIADTVKDDRYNKNIFVTGFPYIRFYAGISLLTHDGHKIGSLCTMDVEPKELTTAQQHLLKVLAKRIVEIIEFEFSINLLKEQFINARESEIKLRSFFETSKSHHLLIDKQLNVLDFNKNMADFLFKMYDVELKQGINSDQILSGVALENFVRDYNIALQGKIVQFEREVTYRNGEKIWWEVTFEPGLNADGEIIGISYNATDITQRKLNEDLILNQNRSLKDIAHIQSHELRKPVASILGLMELIKVNHSSLMSEEMKMLGKATVQLDEKIRMIVDKVASLKD